MFLKRTEKVSGEEVGRHVEIFECDSVHYTRTSKQIILRAIKNGNELFCSTTNVGVDFYILNNSGKTVDSVKW